MPELVRPRMLAARVKSCSSLVMEPSTSEVRKPLLATKASTWISFKVVSSR